jgi:hypothetical protein
MFYFLIPDVGNTIDKARTSLEFSKLRNIRFSAQLFFYLKLIEVFTKRLIASRTIQINY